MEPTEQNRENALTDQARLTVLCLAISVLVLVPAIVPASRNTGLAGVGLILLLATAPLCYDEAAPIFRGVFVVLFVTISLVLLTRVDGFALRLTLAVALAYLTAKLMLLHKFSAIARSRIGRSPSALDQLFDSQLKDLEKLQRAINASSLDDEARVIQLEGRLGDGKSFLLNHLSLFLDNTLAPTAFEPPCAVVIVNVWKHQNEPDLHLALVEEILGHRRFWFPYGWLQFPLSLLAAGLARDIRLVVSAGSDPGARIELPVASPRLLGHPAFERLVSRVHRRRVRTVVVLDEIDRAAPVVAQAAVTLIRRALDIAGVVVVMTFADEIIRYKVFNPLIQSLPDLASTMEALIFANGPDRTGFDPAEDGEAPDSLIEWYAWKRTMPDPNVARPVYVQVSTSGDDAARDKSVSLAFDQISEASRVAYSGAPPTTRRVLQRLFAERYLSTRPVRLQILSDDDVADLVFKLATLKYLVEGLLRQEIDHSKSAITNAIQNALRVWAEMGMKTYETPPIRLLEGELFRRLSALDPAAFKHEPITPWFISAVVLAAYDAAGRSSLQRRT